MTRRSAAALVACLLLAACSTPADPDRAGADAARQPTGNAPETGPAGATGPSLAPPLVGVTFAELRAWEDSRRGLPPLRVVRPDSVSSIVAWVEARRDGWTEVGSQLPGIALPVEFHRGETLLARLGMIERSHGQGGWLVTWDPSNPARAATRPATAAELAQLMAFFGIGTVFVE